MLFWVDSIFSFFYENSFVIENGQQLKLDGELHKHEDIPNTLLVQRAILCWSLQPM